MEELVDTIGDECLGLGMTAFIMTLGLLEVAEIFFEFGSTPCTQAESAVCGNLISSLAWPPSVELLVNLNVSGSASFIFG